MQIRKVIQRRIWRSSDGVDLIGRKKHRG